MTQFRQRTPDVRAEAEVSESASASVQPEPSALIWTERRCDELDRLRQLLIRTVALNRSTNILANLAECIELADGLWSSDYAARHVSFISWLENLAIEDRTDHRPIPVSTPTVQSAGGEGDAPTRSELK